MKPYSIALAANEALDVQVGGDFFLLDSAPQAVSFAFFGPTNMRRDETLESALAGDWVRPKDGFAWVKITNGAVAQTVRFYVARGEVGRFRVQGEVSVISGELTRSNAQRGFLGSGASTAVAAQEGHVQLWNPAGSGKRLIVNQISLVLGGASHMYIGHHNVALANLDTAPSNKRLSGAATIAELRNQTQAGGIGTIIMSLYIATANESFIFRPTEPLVVPPGLGLTLRHGTVNSLIQGSFDFFEEDDV